MKKSVLLTVLSFTMLITSCGGNNQTSSSTTTSSSSISSSSSSSIAKKDFENVSFDDVSVAYDGNEHVLGEVNGAPSGTTITYDSKENHIDVGSYKTIATLTKDGYNTKTLEATLTINPIDFSGLTYEDASVTYDGLDHQGAVKLVGTIPQGTTVSETIKNSSNEVVYSAIEVGTYYYTCVVTNKNFNKKTFTATLEIKANKKDMPVFVSSEGNIYFANGLDNSYVYSLSSDNTTKRIDFASPTEFIKNSSTSVSYITGTALLNSVKEVNGETTKILYTHSNISDFAKKDDNVYYFASNSLTASNSGIYKVDTTDSTTEPVVTKVFEGKSDNLAIYGNYLYFVNKNDNKYLYKMNLSDNTMSLVLSEKVHEFIINDNKLYCTVNGTINDYIGYLDLSSSSTTVTKLTDAAGEYLSIKDGYLYYNYTDLFSKIDSSKKGIWRINLTSKSNTQILNTDDINGFDAESSSSFVYIDRNDLHLYRYNISSKTKTDLLNGFVAPEYTPLNTGGQTQTYGNKIYYLNMYEGKTLYVYDEKTKKNQQLTTNKVQDFFISGDKLYFNQVSNLTNNDLYVTDLKLGGEASKVSTNDVRNMISDGTYIYATHYNWAGVSGGISRMKLDGSEYVKFSDVNGAKNLTIKDGKLYYINCTTGQDNGYIEYINLDAISSTSSDLKGEQLDKKNIKNVKQFAFDGNNIFYIYNGTIENSIRRTDFTSLGEGTKIASAKTNPNEFILSGSYVYYYSYAATAVSSAGFYKVSKNATSDGTQELICGYDSKYYGSNFSITSSNNLYFLNYIPKLTFGDAHTYQLNLSSKVITKIA
jgi:hypothetical protein